MEKLVKKGLEVSRMVSADGETVFKNSQGFGGAVRVEAKTRSVSNGRRVVNTEIDNIWMTMDTEDELEEELEFLAEDIFNGDLVAYKVFHTKPFYEGDTMDINPETKESMNRYSRSEIGTPKEAKARHRRFIEDIEGYPMPQYNPEEELTAKA